MPLTPRGRTAPEESEKLQRTNGALAAPNGHPGQPDGPEGGASQAQTGTPVEPEQAAAVQPAAAPIAPGFIARGHLRRRLRFLRKARELAYRDLGGLVYDLHRFGQHRDELVLAKLATLTQIDNELRAIEDTLEERSPDTVLREAGVAACPRCRSIHGSADRFCPGCGLALGESDLRSSTARPPAGAEAPGAPERPPPGP
jgi:hypothetical protein